MVEENKDKKKPIGGLMKVLSKKENKDTQKLFFFTTFLMFFVPTATFLLFQFVVFKYLYYLDYNFRVTSSGVASAVSVQFVLVWFVVYSIRENNEIERMKNQKETKEKSKTLSKELKKEK